MVKVKTTPKRGLARLSNLEFRSTSNWAKAFKPFCTLDKESNLSFKGVEEFFTFLMRNIRFLESENERLKFRLNQISNAIEEVTIDDEEEEETKEVAVGDPDDLDWDFKSLDKAPEPKDSNSNFDDWGEPVPSTS